MKKTWHVVMGVALIGVLLLTLASSAQATDPFRRLQRQVNRLNHKVSSLESEVTSLRNDLNSAISEGRVDCLSSLDVTQYTDYAADTGGSISALDVTEAGDVADWRVAYFTC